MLDTLHGRRTEEGDVVYWKSQSETPPHGTGPLGSDGLDGRAAPTGATRSVGDFLPPPSSLAPSCRVIVTSRRDDELQPGVRRAVQGLRQEGLALGRWQVLEMDPDSEGQRQVVRQAV